MFHVWELCTWKEKNEYFIKKGIVYVGKSGRDSLIFLHIFPLAANIKMPSHEIYTIYKREVLKKFTRVLFNLKNYSIKLNIYNLKVIKRVIKWSEWEVLQCHV